MQKQIIVQPYEMVVIFSPEVGEDAVKEEFKKIETFIQGQGGDTVKIDYWGRRQLAYPIQNFDHGYYIVSVFEGVGNIVQQLERQLKLTEKVIRHLIVKKDKFAPDFTARIHENTRERTGGFRNFDDPEAAQIE